MGELREGIGRALLRQACLLRPVSVAAGVIIACFSGICPQTSAFDFSDLVIKARVLAKSPFHAQPLIVGIGRFSYDDYRAIHFRPSRTLWPKRRFHLQFFAPGYRFVRAVRLHILSGQGAKRLPFVLSDFRYPSGLYPHPLPPHIGYAGFRLLYNGYHPDPLKASGNSQVIVFLGASYFRVKGADEQFGLSARALAIDTIAPTPEEFPHFIAYWIRRPAPKAHHITVYALLNSPSATGAFRFRVRPGRAVTVLVHSVIFLRKPVHELGFAPLSSMYMYDLCDRRPWAYLRPAIHDSEGLLIKGSHTTVWRQLANPRRVHQWLLRRRHLRGFGLIQRDRDFFDYQSASMRYQARPSVWLTPHGHWRPGAVTLVEIPSPNETNDNIAVFWQPTVAPKVGQAYPLNYRMVWNGQGPLESVAKVIHTYASARCPNKPVRFAVDFKGGALGALGHPGPGGLFSVAPAGLRGRVHCAVGGLVKEVALRPLASGMWRLTFEIVPKRGRPVRVQAALLLHGRVVSEVWDYVLAAEEPPIEVSGQSARPAS